MTKGRVVIKGTGKHIHQLPDCRTLLNPCQRMIDTISMYTTDFKVPEGSFGSEGLLFFERLAGTKILMIDGKGPVHLRISHLPKQSISRFFLRVELPKLINGNNVKLLDLTQTKHAFEMLQSGLSARGIDLEVYKLRPCRVDRAFNVIATGAPQNYLNLLANVEIPRTRLTIEENGLRFRGDASCTSIHNKRTAELSKGHPWDLDCEMIRIESQIRRNRNIQKLLRIDSVHDLIENFEELTLDFQQELLELVTKIVPSKAYPLREQIIRALRCANPDQRALQPMIQLALGYLAESAFGNINHFKSAVKDELSPSAFKTLSTKLRGYAIGSAAPAMNAETIRENIIQQIKSMP